MVATMGMGNRTMVDSTDVMVMVVMVDTVDTVDMVALMVVIMVMGVETLVDTVITDYNVNTNV